MCVWKKNRKLELVLSREQSKMERGGPQEANTAPPREINFLHFWNGYILIELLELGLHHWTLY